MTTLNAQQLLEKLTKKERDPALDVDVTFIFSHHDFDYLIPLAEEIGDLFADELEVEYDSVVIGYDEHPESKDSEGQSPPQFTLTYIGPLTADQFTTLHELAAKRASQHQIQYRGVSAWYGWS